MERMSLWSRLPTTCQSKLFKYVTMYLRVKRDEVCLKGNRFQGACFFVSTEGN